jgi:hypothetical protein
LLSFLVTNVSSLLMDGWRDLKLNIIFIDCSEADFHIPLVKFEADVTFWDLEKAEFSWTDLAVLSDQGLLILSEGTYECSYCTTALEGSNKAGERLHVQCCIAAELVSPVTKAEFPKFATGNPCSGRILI